MNILSKWKDYYDYLTGIYGVDEKIVLDRRKSDALGIVDLGEMIKLKLYICDVLFEGVYIKGKVYWGLDVLKILSKESVERFKNKKDQSYIWIGSNSKYIWRKSESDNAISTVAKYTDLNKKEDCPIILQHGGQTIRYPRLQDINVGSILKPHAIYMMLSEYLAPKDKDDTIQTDKEKIVSAGFDLKTSFRKL